jgi:hypothetical protein
VETYRNFPTHPRGVVLKHGDILFRLTNIEFVTGFYDNGPTQWYKVRALRYLLN